MLQRIITILKIPGALSLVALGAILATLLSAIVYQTQLQKQKGEQESTYGQALANTAAQQAVDGVINQDLVSLQVVLSNIVNNPKVVGATLHDVENLLLVQAGQPPQPPFTESAYSAPITLDEALAGTVTIYTRSNTDTTTTFWYLCFSLSIFAALVLIGIHWQPPWSTLTEQPITDTKSDVETESVTIGAPPAKQEPSTPPILLSLSCSNLNQLNQQLNSEVRTQLLLKLQSNLDRICHLYDGSIRTLEDGRVLLAFCGQNTEDSVFRAVCSSQLILALNQQADGLRLKLCARISQKRDQTKLQDLQYTLTDHTDMLASRHYPLLIQTDILAPALEEKMHWESSDIEGQAEITAIMQPYQKLLENQLLQLSSHQ